MKNESVLILGREDLIECSKTTDIRKLIITDFRWTVNETVKKFNKENMIIFIDTNGETYMLKNRWGVTGKVRGKRM